jgi:hypothetical protein
VTVPFRLLLLRALTSSLKEIVPSDGYTNDLSDFDPGDGSTQERVFRGRAWFGDSDPIPMVSVLEAVEPGEELFPSPQDSSQAEYLWGLLIQGFVKDDPTHPTDPAYYLLQDVRRRLIFERNRRKIGRQGSTDPFSASTFAPDGCALAAMSIGRGVVRPADDVSAKAYFWLPVTLTIVEAPL